MGNNEVIKKVPHTAKNHFTLNFYAAVFRFLNYMHHIGELEKETDSLGKFPFLEKYLSEIMKMVPEEMNWEDGIKFIEQELTAWENASPIDLPIIELSKKNGFDYNSRIALMITGLGEEDSRFGTVIAGLQQPLAHRRASLETIEQIMADNDDTHNISNLLLSSNVIEVMNPDEPRSEWVLRISPFLWEVIKGNIPSDPAPWCGYYPPSDFPEFEYLKFNADFRMKLENVPKLFKDGLADAFILRGMQGEPRLSVMGSVARSMNLGIIVISDVSHMAAGNWKILGPLCIMMRAIPVIICDPGPGETIEVPRIKGTFPGIIMGTEGGIKGQGIERSVTLTIPPPDAAYRRRCWTDALSGFEIDKVDGVDGLELIIERFHMPGDLIRRVSQIAKANAALSGRTTLKLDDVREAARTLNRQLLDTLALRLETGGKWDDLVVGKGVESSLKELEIRCMNRDKLSENMKSGYANNQGVRAIFTGMSGTGKTMAATILASGLGMDIYRVDLAAIVNKYIGETEKNLHNVLARAQELDVILLFDEADALLGSRTEIKSANDRYANLETDYLLQKLENYQGIVIMTTNAPENVDKAFSRRMDMVINFVAPQANERLKIWELHLNNKSETSKIPPIELENIAQRCPMTGGQIRNAAIQATLYALDDGGIVTIGHLVKAVESEYRKAGSLCPLKVYRKTEWKGIGSFFDLMKMEQGKS